MGRCGYGLSLKWTSNIASSTENPPSSSPPRKPFAAALESAAGGLITRLVTPRWAYSLPIRHLQDIDNAYRDLAFQMRGLIREKRAAGVKHRHEKSEDILDCLVRANDDEEKWKLSEEELLSNIFVLYIAGHGEYYFASVRYGANLDF
jgi:cytochrome P450